MKTLTTFLFVLLFACTIAKAQNIKASEGLAKAKSTVTISNPEIMAIATQNGTIPGFPFTITFDMSNGSATGWIYIFRSADNHDTKKTCIAGKVLGTLVGYEIPDITTMPPMPSTSLEGISWIDSDVMIGKVTDAQDYKSFMLQYPNAKPDLIALMYNSQYSQIAMDLPYWLVKINSGGTTEPSLLCAVNALTSGTTCFNVTGVIEENNLTSNNITFAPNPTSDNAVIYIPSNIQSNDSKLYLCDINGSLIRVLFAPKQGESEFVLLNLSEYPQGIYFARYISSGKTYFVKINLIK